MSMPSNSILRSTSSILSGVSSASENSVGKNNLDETKPKIVRQVSFQDASPPDMGQEIPWWVKRLPSVDNELVIMDWSSAIASDSNIDDEIVSDEEDTFSDSESIIITDVIYSKDAPDKRRLGLK